MIEPEGGDRRRLSWTIVTQCLLSIAWPPTGAQALSQCERVAASHPPRSTTITFRLDTEAAGAAALSVRVAIGADVDVEHVAVQIEGLGKRDPRFHLYAALARLAVATDEAPPARP